MITETLTSHILNPRHLKSVEINCQNSEVCRKNSMCDKDSMQWLFNKVRESMHEEWSGWPTVINDVLVEFVSRKRLRNRQFMFSLLFCKFQHISRTVQYEILLHNLNYCKL